MAVSNGPSGYLESAGAYRFLAAAAWPPATFQADFSNFDQLHFSQTFSDIDLPDRSKLSTSFSRLLAEPKNYLAQPQAGSTAAQVASQQPLPQPLSQHLLRWQRLWIRQWRLARKSRTGVGRQHEPQPVSQAGAQPHVGSAAQVGAAAHVGAAAQVGSAAAQVASQQVGAQQLPRPNMRSSRAAALTSVVKTNIEATATKERTYFMGRTPVPIGKRSRTSSRSQSNLGCS